jgi:diketogulonate reductase-like aldo/keto reductase
VRKSELAREEVFISASFGYHVWLFILLTHLQASKIRSPDHGYDKALKKLDKSLSEFGFTYLDLFLIHDPLSGKEKRLETWKAMIKMRDEGKIKSIGVSN